MNHDIFVISLAKTGEDRYPYDEVVEVAICGIDTEMLDMDCVYSSLIRLDDSAWTDERRSYVLEHHGLTAETLENGRDRDIVVKEVKDILKGGVVTSFNIKDDFYGHLLNDPWDLTGEASIAPSIGIRALEMFRVPREIREKGNLLWSTYELMFPADPARVSESHRALDDAMRAGTILIELRRSGHY